MKWLDFRGRNGTCVGCMISILMLESWFLRSSLFCRYGFLGDLVVLGMFVEW